MPVRKAEPFLERLVANPPDTDDCVLWPFAITKAGYAVLEYEGKTRQVTRILMERKHGIRLESRQFVLHSCDNPPCINPRHLSIGNHKENVQQRDSRQRQAHGEGIGTSRLSTKTVYHILDMIKDGELSQRAIAKQLGCSSATVSRISNKKIWKRTIDERFADRG